MSAGAASAVVASEGGASATSAPVGALASAAAIQAKSWGSRLAWAATIILRQIWAGISPPVTLFIGVSSSLPTHTPQTQSGVKPTNQASRQFWLVPVLPAAGRPNAARVPVPSSTTPSIILTI